MTNQARSIDMTPTPMVATTTRPQSEAGMSIVVPVFNEGVGLARFHAQLVGVVRQLRQQRGLATEVIYVDDGSRDDSLAVANTLPAEALDIQVVSLSRNSARRQPCWRVSIMRGSAPCCSWMATASIRTP